VVGAIEALLDRGGDADGVLREAVAVLHELGGYSWVGISFVEDGDLVLGPSAGQQASTPVTLPISYDQKVVAEVVAELGVCTDELGAGVAHTGHTGVGDESHALAFRDPLDQARNAPGRRMRVVADHGLPGDSEVREERLRTPCVFGENARRRGESIARSQRDVAEISNRRSDDEKSAHESRLAHADRVAESLLQVVTQFAGETRLELSHTLAGHAELVAKLLKC